MNLFEESKNNEIHIYQDDVTGDKYYFDGKKLVLIGKAKPITIDDREDEDEQEKEQKYHDNKQLRIEKKTKLDRIRDMLSNTEVGKGVDKETSTNVEKKLKKIKAKRKRI